MRKIKCNSIEREKLFGREATADVSETVREIVSSVEQNGDAALFEYCRRFDGCSLSSFEVSREEIDGALASADPEFVAVLKEAAENICAFHEKQKRTGFIFAKDSGIVTGQRVIPLKRVGLYVPGGTAAYPSTVLMDSIPAKVAGCDEVVIVTPPNREGKVSPAILAAAAVAGVDRIFKVGGAQAVAALAFGTESIPKVDKICGPGNAYVAEAKRQVYGLVDIDMIAGPSEILIVADGKSSPRAVAADLLSQAEHDKNASAVLVTDSESLADAVELELQRQLPLLARREIAEASLNNRGLMLICDSIENAVKLADEVAPEHLELCLDEPFEWLGKVRNAGSVFLGRYCPEAIGDYFAGPNHTLPTGGTARFSSPLSVDDFVKKSQYIYYSRDALQKASPKVALFAETEGLTAHAKSATVRFEKESGNR